MGRKRAPIAKTARRDRKFGKATTGRPAGFKEEYIGIVKALVSTHDYTDAQIAAMLEVNPSTMWRWKMKVPEFGRAFLRGEAARQKTLEASMFHRATGYSHKAVKIFPPRVVVVREKGKKAVLKTEPVIVEYEEHFPPDTTAGFRLLEALDPKRYSQRMKHTGDPREPVIFQMSNRPPKEGKASGTAQPALPKRPGR